MLPPLEEHIEMKTPANMSRLGFALAMLAWIVQPAHAGLVGMPLNLRAAMEHTDSTSSIPLSTEVPAPLLLDETFIGAVAIVSC